MAGKLSKKDQDKLIGSRITALMKSLGMNQTSFAEALDTRPSTVSKWAAGHNRPSPDVFVRIARLAQGEEKIFFLEHAGIPEGYFEGAPMISEIRDATSGVVSRTILEGDTTNGPSDVAERGPIIQLLKNTKKLGDPNAVQAQDVDVSLSFPPTWFPKGASLQAVRFPQLISPFITGEVIALVDVSRRDPDRLAGSIVVVRTSAGTEPMTLRKDGAAYFLVPMREDADHPVRLLRAKGAGSILGRVVKWIGDAPNPRK